MNGQPVLLLAACRTLKSDRRLEQRFCLHDHAVNAAAALHRLLVDERLLQRMPFSRRAQAFEGQNPLAACRTLRIRQAAKSKAAPFFSE